MPDTFPQAPVSPPSPGIPDMPDPFALFETWLQDATASEPNDPNALSLATSTPSGHPSVRMVLLKGYDPNGFVFYTNLDSRKGREVNDNPHAAMLFHWKTLRRQVRIEGPITPVTPEDADAYFNSRARVSRLGAAASDQSRPLPARAELERRVAELDARYPGDTIPRPANWSGLRVIPQTIEFWQDMPYRLHDRRLYTRTPQGWDIGSLYP